MTAVKAPERRVTNTANVWKPPTDEETAITTCSYLLLSPVMLSKSIGIYLIRNLKAAGEACRELCAPKSNSV